MGNKELFKQTEGRLYRYYQELKNIEKLKARVVLLYKQQEQIKKEMQNLQYLNIETGGRAIDYSADVIQSSGSYCGEGEREVEKYINELEKNYRDTVKRMLKTNSKIRELEYQVQDVRFNIESLNEFKKTFVELKYKECRSMDYIIRELFNNVNSTAYREREDIVWDIANFLK